MNEQKTIGIELDGGRMTLTSWAGLGIISLGTVLIVVSHIGCEIRGRDDCISKTTEPLVALLAGSGLLFTHSPAEGALGAIKQRLLAPRADGRRRATRNGRGSRIDPREIYSGGGRNG